MWLENAARKAIGRARPNCRRRSTVFAVALQVGHQLFEREPWYRFASRRPVFAANCRSDPALANAALDDRLWFSSRRHDFGDDAAAIGDDDRLARRRQADKFAELVLQDLEPDGVHPHEVASGGYFVNSHQWK